MTDVSPRPPSADFPSAAFFDEVRARVNADPEFARAAAWFDGSVLLKIGDFTLWMKWYRGRNPAQFERFAKHVFRVDTSEAGIAALQAWYDKIGTPTRLPQLGIKEADLPAIVENVQRNVRVFGIADTYTPEVATAILKNAL